METSDRSGRTISYRTTTSYPRAEMIGEQQRNNGWVRPTARYIARERERVRAMRRGARGRYSYLARLERAVEYVKWSVRNTWEDYLEGDCQLTTAQMDRLRKHKYSAVDTSWLDELCMHRFWNFVVEFYPMWLAPNLITLLGFLINLITVLVLSFFSYNAQSSAPSWAYLQAALGLFVYQTLDATDGKQARRTGSNTPLGELFDHGCDAFSQVFVTLIMCYAMLTGQDRYMVLIVIVISVSLFYCAHWSTYCTGHLKFAKFDVTEAQLSVIAILLITSICGTDFWTAKFMHVSTRDVVILGSGFKCFSQIANYLADVLTGGVGKNGSTVADTSVLSPLIPLVMVVTPFCMIYGRAKTTIYDDNITLFALCFGAVTAKLTLRLVLAHMSRSELAMWDWIHLSPLMMMLNQYYDVRVDEFKLLIFATVYAYGSLLLYSTMICRQLCSHLRIYCFSLQPRNENHEE